MVGKAFLSTTPATGAEAPQVSVRRLVEPRSFRAVRVARSVFGRARVVPGESLAEGGRMLQLGGPLAGQNLIRLP